MSGTIGSYVQSYLDFATVDGTVSGGGTWVLIAGPVLVALLGLYMVWNIVAATASGLVRTARFAHRLTVRPVAPMAVAAPAMEPIVVAKPRPRIEPVRASSDIVLVASAA
jgi:hypothetical protein